MKDWTRYITATCFSILGAAIYGLTWAGGGIVGGMVLLILFFMTLFFAFINLCYFLPGVQLAKIKYVMLSLPLGIVVLWNIDWNEWNKDVTYPMTTISLLINFIIGIYFFFRQLNEG
jgi:hypothetical protein